MSEEMTAEAAYRKEVLLSYDALFLYRTFFTKPEDCCVECVAPADACEEYVQIRRNMDLSREALMEYCGYTVDDVYDLTDNWVANVLKDGIKEETVQFEEKFLEKYSPFYF